MLSGKQVRKAISGMGFLCGAAYRNRTDDYALRACSRALLTASNPQLAGTPGLGTLLLGGEHPADAGFASSMTRACRALPPSSPDSAPGGGGAKSSQPGTGDGLPRTPGENGGACTVRLSAANGNRGGVPRTEVRILSPLPVHQAAPS